MQNSCCPKCAADLSWELSVGVDCCGRCGNRFRYCPACGRDAARSIRDGGGFCEFCNCDFATYSGEIHEPFNGEMTAEPATKPYAPSLVFVGLGVQYLVGLELSSGSGFGSALHFVMIQPPVFGLAGWLLGGYFGKCRRGNVGSSVLGMIIGAVFGVCFGYVGCSLGMVGRF